MLFLQNCGHVRGVMAGEGVHIYYIDTEWMVYQRS